MKIIIAPSKTQNIILNNDYKTSQPLFIDEANKINDILKKFTIDELKSIYKSSDKVANLAFDSIKSFSNTESGQAIFSYTGAVFKEINPTKLDAISMNYLNEHLIILSAHYGILKPLDQIGAYRLDYKMKIPNFNQKEFWSKKINDYFENETILNLASSEFSSLINKPMINISFKEFRNNKYKVIGTYAKMARGKMIHLIATNQISDINQVKELVINQYKYNDNLSNKSDFVFTN